MQGFDPKKPLSEQIRQQLSNYLESAVFKLEEQPDGMDAAIHKARKSLKKSRALLRLCHDASPKKLGHARKRLGVAARSIARMRDAAALVECVEWLAPWLAERRNATLPVLMVDRLRARHGSHLADIDDVKNQIEGAITLCRVTQTSIGKARLKRDDAAAAILAKGWVKRHKKAVVALRACRTVAHDEDFHELRKSAQQTAYQAGLLVRAWPAGLNAIVDDAKKLSEILGHEHDLTMLIALEGSEPGLLSTLEDSPGLIHLLTVRRAQLRDEAIEIAQALYSGHWKNERKRINKLWRLMQ